MVTCWTVCVLILLMIVLIGSQCLRGVALSWYLAMAVAASGGFLWSEFEARFVAKCVVFAIG